MPQSEPDGPAPGRDAVAPTDVPARGWRDVASRIPPALRSHHVTLAAAGVAFFGFLALIPALAAVLAIYGLVADPAQAARQVEDLLAGAPTEVRDLLVEQMSSLAGSSGTALSVTVAVSILLALWAASAGVAQLMEALNLVHDEVDGRSWPIRRGLAVLLTLGASVTAVGMLAVITVVPDLVRDAVPGALGWAVTLSVWLGVAVVFLLGLSVVYRVGPDRADPKWRWVTHGAAVALVLWVGGSLLFSVWVSNFGTYDETYGSLGSVAVLLLWLYLSAFAVLLGAEVNVQSELQTGVDTTSGDPVPMGERGASAADTVSPEAAPPERVAPENQTTVRS